MFSVALYARVRIFQCTMHMRPRVQRAPGLPCALSFEEGTEIPGTPRSHRDAGSRIHIQPSWENCGVLDTTASGSRPRP